MKKILLFSFVLMPILGFSQSTSPSVKITQPPHENKVIHYKKNGVPVPNDDTKTPLLVIDGEVSSFNKKQDFDAKLKSIDPNSIESVDVLKGQKAVDAYGEKGVNGVIVVKKKK